MRALPGGIVTRRIRWPLQSHWGTATCAAYDCQHWREGWVPEVPVGSRQDVYIRSESGREYRVVDGGAPGWVRFLFSAGQTCFKTHRRKLERSPLFEVHRHIRGVTKSRTLEEPERWVDNFQEDLDKLRED